MIFLFHCICRSFSDMVIMVGSSLALAISYFFMVRSSEILLALFNILKVCLLQTFSTDVSNFIAVIFPMTCGLCLVNSVITAAITKLNDEDVGAEGDGEKRSGTLLGLNMAVHSVIRTAAPMLGGHMVASYGFESIGYLGVACHLASLLLLPNTSALATQKTTKVE